MMPFAGVEPQGIFHQHGNLGRFRYVEEFLIGIHSGPVIWSRRFLGDSPQSTLYVEAVQHIAHMVAHGRSFA
jgi:hypothetical protein